MATSSDAARSGWWKRFTRLSFPTFHRIFGNLGGPILLKELRADFRKNRFFLMHFISLAAIATGILAVIWLKGQEGRVTSVQLGRMVFDIFFVMQFFIVLIVFPAFSSTAFTEERANKSLDLLITTTLKPSEVVMGKFLATSGYCLITVLATVPLLAISTLFGGVKMEEIFLAYGILIGLTVLLSITGVFFSSCYTANVRSTLTVYTLVAILFTCGYFLFYKDDFSTLLAEKGGEMTSMGILLEYLARPETAPAAAASPMGFADKVIALGGVVLIGAVIILYLFILTTYRIKQSTDDRSSGLRVLTMVVFAGFFGARVVRLADFPGGGAQDPLGRFTMLAAAFLLAIALIFTTEPAALSRRIRGRFSRLKGILFPLRLFTPGAFWGLLYLAVLLAAVGGTLLYALEAVSPGYKDPEGVNRLRELIITMPIYVFAFGALGFFLATCGFTRGYNLLTVFFIFVITMLLPVIFQIAERPDGIFSFYYLSPITIWRSLEPQDFIEEGGPRYLLYGVRIIYVAMGLFGCLGALFTTLGLIQAHRARLPLLRLEPEAAESGAR